MLEYKGMPSNLTRMALDDHNIKGYRPVLNKFTHSVIASLILNQAMYWAVKHGNPFYKFKLPCGHPLYKDGDSWCEEMGLTRAEFDTGLKYLGQKISKKIIPDQEAFIWYWSDMDNKTYYCVNWGKVDRVIADAYGISGSVSARATEKSGDSFLQGNDYHAGHGTLKSSIPESKNPAFPKADMKQSGKTESGSRYNDTINTQSKPIKTSSSESGTDDDDEFVSNKKVREQLVELGLDESEARRMTDMWEGWLLQEKINDVKRAYTDGKVGNLLAYVKKVFGQRKLYTPSERNEIYRRYLDKKKQNAIKSQAAEKNATEESKQREFIERTDKLIANINQEQIREFEKHLQGKKTLQKMYNESGLDGSFVKAELRVWIDGH